MTEANGAANESLRRIVQEAAENAKSVQDLYSGSEADSRAVHDAIAAAEKVAELGIGSGMTFNELGELASRASDACVKADRRDPHSKSAALAARHAALAAGELLFAMNCERAGISRAGCPHSAISAFTSLVQQEVQRISVT